MNPITVAHVLEALDLGGASRAAVANAASWRAAHGGRLVFVSLAPPSRQVADKVRAQGIEVLATPDRPAIDAVLAGAEIVQLHFYNGPATCAFLAAPIPPCRLLVWCHVGGRASPQVLTADVVALADHLAVAAPRGLDLPAVRAWREQGGPAQFIPGGADLSRLDGFSPRPHDTYNVGYIGTLDQSKIHPDFIAMNARIDIPDIRFIVCGAGEQRLRHEALRANAGNRFDFRGYVEDIRSVLEVTDVFGYPLEPDTYATTDQVVQEAMYAAIPPVVFPYGGVGDMVINGETGIVVSGVDDYVGAIRHLHDNPQERKRLGGNARDYAARHFGSARNADVFAELYASMMRKPKRGRDPLRLPGGRVPVSGADHFLLSLAGSAPHFETSAAGGADAAAEADRAITAESAPMAACLRAYRLRFPDDPLLCLWSGLMHLGAGEHARALIEFRAAAAKDANQARIEPHLRAALRGLGAEAAIAAAAAAGGPGSRLKQDQRAAQGYRGT